MLFRIVGKLSDEEVLDGYRRCAASGSKDMKKRTREYLQELKKRKLPIPHVNMCWPGNANGKPR